MGREKERERERKREREPIMYNTHVKCKFMALKSELKTVLLCRRTNRGLVQDQRLKESDTAPNTAHSGQSPDDQREC